MFLTFVKCLLILVSEDVQEFQKAIMKSGRKHHVIAANYDNDDNDESNSEDEEDENPKNRRRKVSHSQVSADIIH